MYAWRHSELAQIEARQVTEHLVAERGRLERQTAALALLESVATAANEASTVDDAVDLAVAAVCSYTGWPVGHAYLVADTTGELVDTGIWHSDGSCGMDQFKAASQQARLVVGVGLGGPVLRLARATWIADLASDPHFTRNEAAAAAAGLVSAFAFPILVGTEVAGVLEFFADDHLMVGEELLALMDQVGTQLGRVIERHRATALLRTSEERVRSIVETASDAFISMGAHGVVTDWNRRAEAMFGWPAAEALGRPVAEFIVPAQHRAADAGGLQRFLSTGDGPVLGRRVELAALHRDGSEFPVELAVWAMGSGEQTVFNAFVQDISERVRAQDNLEQAYRSVSEAVAALERRNREVTLMSEMGELLQELRHDGGDLRGHLPLRHAGVRRRLGGGVRPRAITQHGRARCLVGSRRRRRRGVRPVGVLGPPPWPVARRRIHRRTGVRPRSPPQPSGVVVHSHGRPKRGAGGLAPAARCWRRGGWRRGLGAAGGGHGGAPRPRSGQSALAPEPAVPVHS